MKEEKEEKKVEEEEDDVVNINHNKRTIRVQNL